MVLLGHRNRVFNRPRPRSSRRKFSSASGVERTPPVRALCSWLKPRIPGGPQHSLDCTGRLKIAQLYRLNTAQPEDVKLHLPLMFSSPFYIYPTLVGYAMLYDGQVFSILFFSSHRSTASITLINAILEKIEYWTTLRRFWLTTLTYWHSANWYGQTIPEKTG